MKTLILLSALMLSGCGIANPEASFSVTVESEMNFTDAGQITQQEKE